MDLGNEEVICGGGPPAFELFKLVSNFSGRAGTELSAGDLAVGTYVFRW
ncbi:MAG: hypothetical protein ACREOF_09275 [Gemmatimonadales bacterium]